MNHQIPAIVLSAFLAVPGSMRTPNPATWLLGPRPQSTPKLVPTPAASGTQAIQVLPACAASIRDQANPGQCIQATSVPTPGLLFPPPHDGGVNNVSSGTNSFIGGGQNNQATNGSGAGHTTIAGGWGNIASGNWATVGGGFYNAASGDRATIGGGGGGNTASGYTSTIGGGSYNTASGTRSAIGGGLQNQASATHATVAGGRSNIASEYCAAVGGGYHNTASIGFSTVGGGRDNRAMGNSSTISGGRSNTAWEHYVAVGGGFSNVGLSRYSTIGGGRYNSAGYASTVGGGWGNVALNNFSAVPGGFGNVAAGQFSFAAGRQAMASHFGSFVWGDSQDTNIKTSSANDEFNVYASGGVRMFTDSGATTGVLLAPGGGSWSSVSDRALKDNVAPVDAKDILERVCALPISTWNYETQADSIRHMGPMAQDFHAAFGLGVSDKTIDTIDSDGVALAAIQGLNQRINALVAAKDAEIAELRAEIAWLRQGQAPVTKRPVLPEK